MSTDVIILLKQAHGLAHQKARAHRHDASHLAGEKVGDGLENSRPERRVVVSGEDATGLEFRPPSTQVPTNGSIVVSGIHEDEIKEIVRERLRRLKGWHL